MGAIFSVPVAHASPAQLPGVTVALDAGAERPLSAVAADLEPKAEISVLVGAERAGLPGDVLAACDHVARIPIRTDSLNAALAAGVALYELSRTASS